MTSSPAPGSRLVDYFFIAGIKDQQILSTYHSTRDGKQDDELYYHRQQIAIQPNDNNRTPNHLQRDGSFGVLDHVQAVIDHFDKERDHARNTVIAVHDQECLAEKYNMAGGGSGVVVGRHRSASANESCRKRKRIIPFCLFFFIDLYISDYCKGTTKTTFRTTTSMDQIIIIIRDYSTIINIHSQYTRHSISTCHLDTLS